MADEITDLGIRITVDASGAVTGIDQAKTAVAGLGDKAAEGLDKASTAGERMGDKVAAGGKEAADALSSVLGPSAKLEAQITKTGNALSPRGIVDGAAKIRIALEDIETHARATGKAIGPDLAAQIQRAEAAIAVAIPRAGRLADTIADTRKQAGLAAEGYKVLRSAGSGLQSVFEDMDDAGVKWVSTLGKVGIAAFGITNIIGLARDIVKGATTAIQDQLNKADAWALKMDKVRAEHDRTALAVAAATRGTIAFGGSIQETVRNLDLWTASQGRNRPLIEEMAKAVGLTMPQSITVFTTKLKEMDSVTSAAMKMGAASFRQWAIENESALKAAQEQARITGEVLPPAIRKAIAEAENWTKANRDLKTSIDELNKAHTFDLDVTTKRIEGLKQLQAAQQDAIASSRAAAGFARDDAEARMRALREENVGLEEFSRRKKEIYAEQDRIIEEATAREEAALERLKPLREAELAERQKLTPVIEEQTQSMQGLVDQMNASGAAADAQREQIARLHQETATAVDHFDRLRHIQAQTRGEIEATNETFTDGEGKIHDMTMGVDGLTDALSRLGG